MKDARKTRAAILFVTLLLVGWFSATAHAYSVLAHEVMIDAAWSGYLEPLIRARFPAATAAQIAASRAHAYGGSLIQDIGYYPFGSRFLSNLLHYARSGDFVEAIVSQARTPEEYTHLPLAPWPTTLPTIPGTLPPSTGWSPCCSRSCGRSTATS